MKITFINSAEISDELLAEWLLEADENKQREINRMQQADKRRLRIAADHLCRAAAAEALGLSPAEVKFGKNEHGKPTTDGIEFNLSHSGNIAVCAVSGKPVGIDIEALREIRPDVAKRFASAEELEYIGSDPRRLFEIWTLKEAYFKCVGTGIGSDIKLRAGLHLQIHKHCGRLYLLRMRKRKLKLNNYLSEVFNKMPASEFFYYKTVTV